MPDSAQTANTERVLAAWIENRIGRVVRMERQARWRPCWVVDAECDGQIVPLFVKGSREVHAITPVKLEGAALDVLHRYGIPAPRQYGYCDEIDAIVMERLPGESRLEKIEDPSARDKIVDQYVQAMVKYHALDAQLFVDAGFKMLSDPADLRLAQFFPIEKLYLAKKRVPEAANEFLRLWLRRNVPREAIRPSFIVGDSFQMMYHEGALKAVMDLEMATIGDPLLDLSCIRMRDLSEKTGDAAAITRRYAELSGKPIDYKVLRFHLVVFSAVSSMLVSDVMSKPADDTDYLEYYIYYRGCLRLALEAQAEFLGLTLEPFVPPEAAATAQSVHWRMLSRAIEQVPAEGELNLYLRGKAMAEAAHLARMDRYGAAFDRTYLDDVERVLGTRPRDVLDAEARLEAFVHRAGPQFDETLMRLFHRRELQLAFLADIPQNKRLQRFLMEPIAKLD
jgi:hypothetical protein